MRLEGQRVSIGDLFRDLKNALCKTELDLTQGNIGRAVSLLAAPMMLEMVMESAFAIVDMYFVASLGP